MTHTHTHTHRYTHIHTDTHTTYSHVPPHSTDPEYPRTGFAMCNPHLSPEERAKDLVSARPSSRTSLTYISTYPRLFVHKHNGIHVFGLWYMQLPCLSLNAACLSTMSTIYSRLVVYCIIDTMHAFVFPSVHGCWR